MDALMDALEELQEVNEVGPRIADSIREFFAEPSNRKLVERLRQIPEFQRRQESSAAPLWPARRSS